MNSLIEMYHEVFGKLKSISDQIHKIEHEITDLKSRRECEDNVLARIRKLEEQLVKIDEYLAITKEFQVIAKKNLTSMNVLTIATPPGYRVNLNRLRKWITMIDKTSANDPYAQRVLAVAKCDEQFLEKKRKEFNALLAELRTKNTDVVGEKIDEIEAKIHNLKLEIKFLLESQNIFRFAERVVKENEQFQYKEIPEKYKNGEDAWEEFALGAYGMPMPLDSTYAEWFQTQFGKYYDKKSNQVLLPSVMPLREAFMITVSCAPSMDIVADKAVQHMLLSMIDNCSVGLQKVYIIDGLRLNTSSVGSLRMLEHSFAMAEIPRNKEQITETLEKILFSFASIDEKLGDCDSVAFYNSKMVSSDSERIAQTTVVLCGWPNAYDDYNKELLSKIMTNYERYGVSFIIVSYESDEDACNEWQNLLPDYAKYNAVTIRMNADGTTTCKRKDMSKQFMWYTLESELSAGYADSVKAHVVEEAVIDSEYESHYSLTEYPQYVKGNKTVELPIGVDSKNKVWEISFEEEGTVFLTGANRCEREQVLHSFITSVIRKYHPDDVELWLADFTMNEFEQYTNPLPPHVRYILSEDTRELACDLIDRLTEKLEERQQFLTENAEMERIGDSTSAYMPVIFVVVENFNRMVHHIVNDESYMEKMRILLENGNAAGIKFVLEGQNCDVDSDKIPVLNSVYTRIALKNSDKEMNAALELSSDPKMNRVKTWMGAIPKQYALVKYKENGQEEIKLVKLLHFSGQGKAVYESQRKFVDLINEQMSAVEAYDVNDVDVYVEKAPIMVIGNNCEEVSG